jgi:tetratricopeptide (TPR) repeat protein
MRHILARSRGSLLALALVLASSRLAFTQAGACQSGHCPDQPGTTAATLSNLSKEFAGAIGTLARSLASVAVDGAVVQANIEAAQAAFERWEQATRSLQTASARSRHAPDDRIALARTFADRRRLNDALQELQVAARETPGRADVRVLMALVNERAGNTASAAEALLSASAIDPDDPATYYLLARQREKMGNARGAQDALRIFREHLEKRLVRPDGGASGVPRFPQLSSAAPYGRASPTFPPARYAPGFALLAGGRFEDALTWFRKAAAQEALAAGASRARDQLALAHAAMRQGDLMSALERLADAVVLAPDDVEAHRLLGAAYAVDGQYDRSLEQFRAAIRLEPNDERSWVALADLLAAGGQFAQVERVLADAIRLIPDSAQLHFSLGRLDQSLGRYADAARELETASSSSLALGGEALFEMIGSTYVTLAAFDRAAEIWIKRIEADPNDADAHRRLGEARLRQDRDDEAVAEYLSALWIEPRNAESLGQVARLHFRGGRYTEAAAAATRALELDPALKDAQYILGTALMRLGRGQEAAAHMEEFQRLEAMATATASRAHTLELLKRDAAISIANADYEKAASLLRDAVALEPDVAATHLALGFVLMQAAHHAEAVLSLERALALGSTPETHRYLAEAYKALGELDKSRNELQAYRQAMQELKSERLSQISQARR